MGKGRQPARPTVHVALAKARIVSRTTSLRFSHAVGSRTDGVLVAEKEEVVDSPTGWVKAHIRRYVETDGAKGHK
jgi:hypothetical protein